MQEHYINAMNLLQNIPTANLSQEYVAKIIIKKSQILRELDLAESAITLLRRRIEFIADSYVRAMLTYELAKCYIEVKDYTVARKELIDCISFLGTGQTAQQASLLLARVYFKKKEYNNASQTLLKLLQVVDFEEIEDNAYTLLGDIYTKQNKFDKAALAYAHKLDALLAEDAK
jgi:TolA-binding protein